MSSLGKNGRFANQLFQYAFLRIYAKRHGCNVETPSWVGQYLFGLSDPMISRTLPEVRQQTYKLTEDHIPNAVVPYVNVDFWGYFQYHTSYYVPDKEYFRSLFTPTAKIRIEMEEAMKRLRRRGKTVIALHLRRGDYGHHYFYVTPTSWYRKWLEEHWNTLDAPVLFIASDEPSKVVGDFRDYKPVTCKDLGVTLPKADFYPDFYVLSQSDTVIISNSTFSFAACMLNKRGHLFLRPHLKLNQFIPFDPWDSEPLIRDV